MTIKITSLQELEKVLDKYNLYYDVGFDNIRFNETDYVTDDTMRVRINKRDFITEYDCLYLCNFILNGWCLIAEKKVFVVNSIKLKERE